MKKLLIILVFLSGSILFAQSGNGLRGPSIRLTAYTTYAFDDNHIESSYYSTTAYFTGSLKGGLQWGGGLEYLPIPTTGIEFTYYRLDSKAPLEYYGTSSVQYTTFDVASNHFFIGGNQYFKVNPVVEPFAGFQLGMSTYNVENPDNHRSDQAAKFSWGIKAGCNLWATEKIGIKLQAGLLSSVQAIGGGIYFGTGGSGASISGFSTYFQFNLGGGLVFNFGL
jgi:hypothetical protein